MSLNVGSPTTEKTPDRKYPHQIPFDYSVNTMKQIMTAAILVTQFCYCFATAELFINSQIESANQITF